MSGINELLNNINSAIGAFVWGIPMIALLLLSGIYFSVRSGFFQIRHFGHIMKNTIMTVVHKDKKKQEKGTLSQFQALSTALAATIGTGNIVGVATAILIGGAGAVFWMWVSAFLGMMTAFTENVLGIYYRKKDENGNWQGGTMCYLENAFSKSKIFKGIGKTLASLFAIFCVCSSFGSGNMVQTNSIAAAISTEFSINPIITGIFTAILAGIVIIGGVNRIGEITEKLIPIMSLFFIGGALIIIVKNYALVPQMFVDIFSSAFGVDAIGGGLSAIMVKRAVTLGFQRGIASNEAGMGSAPMVHSTANVDEPVVQGMWAVFQVFFDTIVICTLTALSILSSGVISADQIGIYAPKENMNAVHLVKTAFSTGLGDFSGVFLTVLIVLFAFTTVIGWCFYGEKAAIYLFGTKVIKPYRILYIGFMVAGSALSLELVWDIASNLNGLMAIPNLIGILALSNTAFSVFNNYNERIFKGKKIVPLLSSQQGY